MNNQLLLISAGVLVLALAILFVLSLNRPVKKKPDPISDDKLGGHQN